MGLFNKDKNCNKLNERVFQRKLNEQTDKLKTGWI